MSPEGGYPYVRCLPTKNSDQAHFENPVANPAVFSVLSASISLLFHLWKHYCANVDKPYVL